MASGGRGGGAPGKGAPGGERGGNRGQKDTGVRLHSNQASGADPGRPGRPAPSEAGRPPGVGGETRAKSHDGSVAAAKSNRGPPERDPGSRPSRPGEAFGAGGQRRDGPGGPGRA